MSESSPPPPSPGGAAESTDSAILRLLMQTIPDRIYFKDGRSRFVRVNWAHARWLGLASPEEAVGKSDFDFFSAQHAAAAFADEERILRTGQPLIGETEMITKADGSVTWGSTTKMPWRDGSGRIIGTFGITRDVTAAKRAEEKLTEERNLLRTIIDNAPSRVYVKDEGARYLINNQAHLKSLGAARQEDATGRTAEDFFAGPKGRQAMEDDRRVLADGPPIVSEERSEADPGGGLRWSLTTKVPVKDVRGRIVGLVGISHDITRRKLAEEELQRRSAEMEADLNMARQIQEAFFPHAYPSFPEGVPPERSRLRFAHRYQAATSLGGDYFDVIALSDTRCGFLISDVMGHGVRAGLLTALIRGVVEEMGTRADDPSRVLAEINRGLTPFYRLTGQPLFATAFFGVIDLEAASIEYSNAGHPAPLVLNRSEGRIDRLALGAGEPAAGLMDGFAYSRHSCAFRPGSLLLGYTDGLVEAADATGRPFGDEALLEAMREHPPADGPELLDRLLSRVKAFTGSATLEDDLCLLTVESVQPGKG